MSIINEANDTHGLEFEGHGQVLRTVTEPMHVRLTADAMEGAEPLGMYLQKDRSGVDIHRYDKYKLADGRFMFRPASFTGSDIVQEAEELTPVE